MTFLKRGDRATLEGIERDAKSPLCGQVVCLTINLWNTSRRTQRVGALLHGTPVTILNSDIGLDGRRYYKVEGMVDGERQEGWVSWPFIKEHPTT